MISGDESDLGFTPHHFLAQAFYVPASCAHCWELIWLSNGLRCDKCNLCAHKTCAPRVEKHCGSPYEATPTRKVKQVGTRSFNRHNIVKEGLLKKMALADASWNPVWCILKGESLYLFRPKEKKMQYQNPLSSINLTEDLCSIHVVNSLDFPCFVIYSRETEGEYYLAAATRQELDAWVEALKTKKKKLTYQPGTNREEYEETPKEMAESWIDICTLGQREFAWEDVPIKRVQLINRIKLSQLNLCVKRETLEPIFDIGYVDPHVDAEISYFRLKVSRLIDSQHIGEKLRLIYAEITDVPLPLSFPERFLVVFWMGRNKVRVPCRHNDTLGSLITQELLRQLKPVDLTVSWAPPSDEDFVIKIGSGNEYIFDFDVQLSSILYVRECMIKSKEIEFHFVEHEPLKEKARSKHQNTVDMQKSYSSIDWDVKLGIASEFFNCHDVANVNKNFELKVIRVENFTKQVLYNTNKFFASDIEAGNVRLFVVVRLYYGFQLLAKPRFSQPAQGEPVWDEWITFQTINIADLPRETKVNLTFYAYQGETTGALARITKFIRGGYTEFVPLGWVNLSWVDFNHVVRSGPHRLNLWPPVEKLNLACGPNSDPDSMAIVVQFDSAPKCTMIFDDIISTVRQSATRLRPKFKTKQSELDWLKIVLKKDALHRLELVEKKLIWKYRYYIQAHLPSSLPHLLLSVPLCSRKATQEAYRLLVSWENLRPIHALTLLDNRFPDQEVRRFAVNCLRRLTDRELVEYLPQLIQVVKSELHHYSALSEFLVLRGVRSIVVGHPLFWLLTSEIHHVHTSVRFKLMIEGLLQGYEGESGGVVGEEFRNELYIVNRLAEIALEIKKETTPQRRNALLKRSLKSLTLPRHFQLPINPKFDVTSLVIDKCRVMNSNTKPLWLVFENSDGEPTQVIFKAGDDLRTDILALQMIRIMDSLWKNEGLDLHMQPYRAMCTGQELGVIEVITHSKTNNDIQQMYGGGTMATFSDNALRDWLRDCNPTEKAHQEAVRNFILSCAGYCVATYILGIGDRHNDNIMVSYTGNLFHIDFGYFLGERTTFMGMTRETTPFVLTSEFASAMGGEGSDPFRFFEETCCKAYNIIRKHGNLFITLFVMMLSSGIPLLSEMNDLKYLRDALSLELNDTEASSKFRDLIAQSLRNQMVKVNNFCHVLGQQVMS